LQSPLATQAPTPTIYIRPSQTPLKTIQQNTSLPSPTPTIYIVPTQSTTTMPTPTPEQTTQQTYDITEIPTVSPTIAATPTAVPTAEPTVQTGPVDLNALFNQYSAQYNVSAAELEKIAQCESGFNTNSDTGVYAGMFQFSATTWDSERNSMGLDPNPDLRKNAEETIKTTAFMLAHGGENAWPNCH